MNNPDTVFDTVFEKNDGKRGLSRACTKLSPLSICAHVPPAHVFAEGLRHRRTQSVRRAAKKTNIRL